MASILVERIFEVRVPIDAAWRLLSEVESWPEWAPHIRSIRLAGDQLGPESEGEFRFRPVGSATFAMTDWQPTSSWTWHGRALGLPIDYSHRFRSIADDVTELTWTVSLAGVEPGLRSKLFTRVYSRNIDRAWPSFVTWAEQRQRVDTRA